MFRKIVATLAILGLLAAAAGCTTSETGTTAGAPGTATTEVATTEAAGALNQPWGGTAVLEGLEITVAAPVDDTGNLDDITREVMLEPDEKAVYCLVSIENTGDEPYDYNTLAFTMYDLEGNSYDSLMTPCSRPDLGSGQVLPGKTVKGAVAFTMPQAASPSYVVFQRNLLSDIEAKWGD